MHPNCPYCHSKDLKTDFRNRVRRSGFFRRKCDGAKLVRYLCSCKRSFSTATFDACFRQRKRHLNFIIAEHLASSNSQRRTAKLLRINKNTVTKKFKFLGPFAYQTLHRLNSEHPKSQIIEFDDQETFEHSKLKPLSITLAVQSKSRRILGFAVSQMPAKGHLARLSRKKYGVRIDERYQGRSTLFSSLKYYVDDGAVIKSDQNPHYLETVRRFFPNAKYETYKGQRGSTTGQGELKKIRWDPLFSLNHTCAKIRADVNRLFRKTWCTTKKKDQLGIHLALFAVYHNLSLEKKPFTLDLG
jgi:hypothetical protein